MILHELPEIADEVLAATEWYECQRSGLGAEFLEDLQFALDHIRNASQSLPKSEWYSGIDDVRRYVLHRFPYSVIVRRDTDAVLIVAVSHHSRRPGYWTTRIG